MKLICALTLVTAFSAVAQPNIFSDILEQNLQQHSATICDKFSALPPESCTALVKAAAESASWDKVDKNALKEGLKEGFAQPQFLNSALNKAFGETPPIGLKFKSLDVEDGDNVLAVTFEYAHSINKKRIESKNGWNRSIATDFKATGTLTQDAAKNPHNFIEAKFTLNGNWFTDIPEHGEEFAKALSDLSLAAAQCGGGVTELTPENCKANEKGLNYLASTSEFLNSYQNYQLGVDLGYEADQEFKATQTKVSAFVFAQYEDWGDNSWLGALSVTPAVRLGVDTIDPNNKTPRALAGDNTSYYRFSGEVSLWAPLTEISGTPIVFTFNYRYYKELSPSEIVKNGNLDSYQFKTYSLSGTNGLFVSYSSGRLPFDRQTNNVVELGWQTHF